LLAALDAPPPEDSSARATAVAAGLRERIAEDQRAAFDDLVVQARLVNRLRDERGLYSDTPAMGILRRVMLEFGRRLVARGRLEDPAHALDAGQAELEAMLRGSGGPAAGELSARASRRSGDDESPDALGPPAPEPPPVDQLPPPLARSMGAIGFAVGGILGAMPEPTGTADTVVGIGIGNASFTGRARVVLDFDDLFTLEPGEVLVTQATMESFNAMLHLVGAIVTDHGSFASHAAIMARELGLPAVVGTLNGTRRISTGDQVTVNGASGEVTIAR
jgi:pyruvate,water dikinase